MQWHGEVKKANADLRPSILETIFYLHFKRKLIIIPINRLFLSPDPPRNPNHRSTSPPIPDPPDALPPSPPLHNLHKSPRSQGRQRWCWRRLVRSLSTASEQAETARFDPEEVACAGDRSGCDDGVVFSEYG